MTQQVDTYAPKDIILIVAGKIITGFTDDMISVSYEVNQVEDEAGADGEVVRRILHDTRGTITANLQQTSRSNLILSGLANVDRLSGDGVFPVVLRNNRGLDLVVGGSAWIQKQSDMNFTGGLEGRAWEIRIAHMQMIIGGAS